ncbi:CpXC domain-containing protein (plasmid) [Candidatus Chlorohelix allophototropha]|uniref:CpXC domain-containing protein n=3 Tax=Candidatus Chlorohelix allophototropha TaxID=3003348 RepID=A0ABY9BAS1_9CHLR|nr:CpXC domain-containing protein [Chloroflexota bacterium L227-S17]
MLYPAPQPYPLDCPQCGKPFETQVHTIVLPGSPAFEALKQAELNRSTCPHCGQSGYLLVPFVLYQPGRVTCFIPHFQAMSEQARQELVAPLVSMLRQVAGEEFEAEGQVQVGVSENYETMVQLAKGEVGAEGEEAAKLRYLIGILQLMLQVDAVQLAALKAKHQDKLPALVELAEGFAAQENGRNPAMVEALQALALKLKETTPIP